MTGGPILVTGFEPYGRRGLNPATEVARALAGRRIAGTAIESLLLPVSIERSGAVLSEALRRLSPRLVLSLGLWPGEPVIRIERRAVNLVHYETPDNDGRRRHNERVSEGGPAAFEVTLPVERALAALAEKGIPARPSESAGTFLCNATLYRLLGIAASEMPEVPCGFVHLPYLPAQVADIIRQVGEEGVLEAHQRADYASMSLETMLDAVATIIAAALPPAAAA